MKVRNVYTSGAEANMTVALVVTKDDAIGTASPPIAIPPEVREAIINYLAMEEIK